MMDMVRAARWLAGAMWRRLGNAAVTIADWIGFARSWRRYNMLASTSGRPRAELRYASPCVGDNRGTTPIEPIYFYQDAWAFERIIERRPTRHVDIGSHHKFVALLSKVVPVETVDLRPWTVTMDSVAFRQGSILALPYADRTLNSLSSLCVIEHVGLGRYGDPLDADGTHKALAELKRVTAPGGDLYISLPIDDVSRVYFNAHRALSEREIEALVAPFGIVERAYIFGNAFLSAPRPGFGIGCYHLRRPAASVPK